MRRTRLPQFTTLMVGWLLCAAPGLCAQQDPALALFDDFQSMYARLPELPSDIELCRRGESEAEPFLKAAEYLFAYMALSSDQDAQLRQTLGWLERAAIRDCEGVYSFTAGRPESFWSRSLAPEIDGVQPVRAPDYASADELAAARSRISALETALAESRQAVAVARQEAEALRGQVAEIRSRGFGPTDRRGCWYGTATDGVELRRGWFCLFDGQVEGPGPGVSGPIATFLSFEAGTFELVSWVGYPEPGAGAGSIELRPRTRDTQMGGSLAIQADGQLTGRLELGPRRVLRFQAGRIR